jgi:diacylglycerol kinase
MDSKGLVSKFAWAIAGLVAVIREEPNMRIHLLAAAAVIGAGWIFNLQRAEWGLLVIAVTLVLVTEVINSAIERIVDLITPQYHPLAEKAKNMGAGAVLVSALAAVALGVIIFIPHLFKV